MFFANCQYLIFPYTKHFLCFFWGYSAPSKLFPSLTIFFVSASFSSRLSDTIHEWRQSSQCMEKTPTSSHSAKTCVYMQVFTGNISLDMGASRHGCCSCPSLCRPCHTKHRAGIFTNLFITILRFKVYGMNIANVTEVFLLDTTISAQSYTAECLNFPLCHPCHQ